MFKILAIYKRNSIGLLVKHLLYRYEVILTKSIAEAEEIMRCNDIHLIVIDIEIGNNYFNNFILKNKSKYKIITLMDTTLVAAKELQRDHYIAAVADRYQLSGLVDIVESKLNKAKTRIMREDFSELKQL